ncbi:MAG: transposase [Christensenellaceae bacterium]|jgi:hypothetical protein|nr:transposase [Christensenellaceae bacterium]
MESLIAGFAQARYNLMDQNGEPLVKLNKIINWDVFREIIEKAIHRETTNVGRPPYDSLLMFKIINLQKWYTLSDAGAQNAICNRLDFTRFLGLDIHDKIPDAATIWEFKKTLKALGVYDELFDMLDKMIKEAGIVAHKGCIVDATFVMIPKRQSKKKI